MRMSETKFRPQAGVLAGLARDEDPKPEQREEQQYLKRARCAHCDGRAATDQLRRRVFFRHISSCPLYARSVELSRKLTR